MTRLQLQNQLVEIEAGELVSYQVDGHEFIHQKGSPGWGSADTEMFPIIGPVNDANFRVQTPRGVAVQDQHGHLRLMPYSLENQSEVKATYTKAYEAETAVKNAKFPLKSSESLLNWPYSFSFKKQFYLTAKGLEISFLISGEARMPFMLGYHPAFKLHTKNPMIKTNGIAISLDAILAVGSRAFEVPNCKSITLLDKKILTITTEGFEHFMCWTEVPNMVCIEPITFYPYSVKQQKLHQGFQQLQKEKTFKVALFPRS